MIEITSFSNSRLKEVNKLRKRRHRDQAGLMIIEGYRELSRAMDAKIMIHELYYCPELFQQQEMDEIIDKCEQNRVQLFKCDKAIFEKISYRDTPDGLLALAPQISTAIDILDQLKENALIVVAEAIEKPGNLGTILRSADGAGVDAVIICDKCTDINNPNVIRASTGTIFSVPVIETSTEKTVKWLHENKFTVVATTPHTDKIYTDIDMTGPTAIVVGTEKDGLSDKWLNQNNAEVKIPMHGIADSLNVSTATTILLYEALRQRSMRIEQ
ncbi:MAG: RNA methyltransferase [Kiritimatiellae bacterium]|jgi:TrmH family RNA methyltransferase|nr:RNA methyltransferase [Kiritimatiellia bacterium]